MIFAVILTSFTDCKYGVLVDHFYKHYLEMCYLLKAFGAIRCCFGKARNMLILDKRQERRKTLG